MPNNDKKQRHERLRVAFQGERGAFSEMTAHSYFTGHLIGVLACSRFKDVFEAVRSHQAAFGVLPIENALTGSVHENYDLLLTFPDIKISGEHIIRIEHNLIGLPGASISDIRQVYSHPQALMQCAEYLESLNGGIQQLPFYDTAGSVAHIAEKNDKTYGAIASREAAKTYGMEILQAGIETNRHNYTRFFIICRTDHHQEQATNKGSIVFNVPNRPGSLFKCLKILADRGINMTKLESRPIHGRPWEYMFYADFMLPEQMDDLYSALAELEEASQNLRLLGLYKEFIR